MSVIWHLKVLAEFLSSMNSTSVRLWETCCQVLKSCINLPVNLIIIVSEIGEDYVAVLGCWDELVFRPFWKGPGGGSRRLILGRLPKLTSYREVSPIFVTPHIAQQ